MTKLLNSLTMNSGKSNKFTNIDDINKNLNIFD